MLLNGSDIMTSQFTRFNHEFVGYNNAVIAVPYTGVDNVYVGGFPVSGTNKKPEEMTRADKFKVGQIAYLSDLGDIGSLNYRIKRRTPGETGRQTVIAGIPFFNNGGSLILELDFPGWWGTSSEHSFRPVRISKTTDLWVNELLPLYSQGNFMMQQERDDPAGLLLVGNSQVKFFDNWHFDDLTKGKLIVPDSGRWTRYYHPNGVRVDPKKERIYAVSESVKRQENITDSLHKAGVDIPRTLERFEDFGRWKKSDDIF